MIPFLWVCFAGAIGTGLRYLVSLWASRTLGGEFPFGTLIVNVLGCFFISLVMCLGLEAGWINGHTRLAVTTGLLGGLTTYSAFNYETTRLLTQGDPRLAAANFAVTTLLCLAAGWAGLLVARRFIGG